MFRLAPPLPPSPITLTILTIVSQCVSNWLTLGQKLGLAVESLETIAAKRQPVREKTLAVLREWLDICEDQSECRDRLVSVLQSLGYTSLIDSIKFDQCLVGAIN